ncbi:MAG TPA: hypothetical protein VHY08_17185, partial [Bacillota bacterium]|nr:hypothetical protein [Bacillota bacterium]
MKITSILVTLILILGLVFILFALGFILYRGVTAWIQKKRLGSKVLTIGFTLNRFLIGALI